MQNLFSGIKNPPLTKGKKPLEIACFLNYIQQAK
jgi:hypothetical protein